MAGNRHLRTLFVALAAGSRPGTGDDSAFDPDGNAAEWAATADGSGIAIGPGAGRPDDPRGRTGRAPAHTGLRVVAGSGT